MGYIPGSTAELRTLELVRVIWLTGVFFFVPSSRRSVGLINQSTVVATSIDIDRQSLARLNRTMRKKGETEEKEEEKKLRQGFVGHGNGNTNQRLKREMLR